MTIDEIKKALQGLEDLGSDEKATLWKDAELVQFYQALFLGEIALKLAYMQDDSRTIGTHVIQRLEWIKAAVR